jgi:BirA family biotin operon repressor/biotin-[acetyl-CoA-carboxylase] ligase
MSTSLDERWRKRDLSQALESIWRAHRACGAEALPPIDVQAVAEVDSTNTRLLEAARDDATPHLRLLVAQAQTAGRGRLGRAWHASPGASLAFSLAVPMAPDPWSSLIVGAAVADAVEPQRRTLRVQPRVMLKWPNDVWLRDASSPFGGRKLGGILLETATTPAARVLVVGIGLNLRAMALPDAPGYGVATLDEIETADDLGIGPPPGRSEGGPAPSGGRERIERGGGKTVDGPGVLLRVAPAVLAALLRPRTDTAWRESWVRRDLLAGKRIEAGTANERITGIARGIDDDGALRLQRDDGGQIVAISSGEVSVRPLPE